MSTEFATRAAIPRNVTSLALETLADTPITVLQGARQVGKSTLATQLVEEVGGRLLSLDSDEVLEAARHDPAWFVRQVDGGTLALDEVQRAPELVRAVKGAVDEDRRPGRFLFTGSSNLLHLSGAEESLAGRAETVPLYGFSQGELAGRKEDLIARLLAGEDPVDFERAEPMDRTDYARLAAAGSYPEALQRSGRRRERWYRNYVERVLERDAVEISRLVHAGRLSGLLKLIAAMGSGEVVKARLARGVDMPETSVPPYLRLLEDLGLIQFLPPWGRNLAKRVVGRNKVAVLDTGLAAELTGLSEQALGEVTGQDHLGGLLEALTAGELRRQQSWSAVSFEIRHFRDREGREVDIVVEARDGRLIGLEVKASRSISAGDFRGLEYLREHAGDSFVAGLVLHSGPEVVPFGPRLWSAPLSLLWS